MFFFRSQISGKKPSKEFKLNRIKTELTLNSKEGKGCAIQNDSSHRFELSIPISFSQVHAYRSSHLEDDEDDHRENIRCDHCEQQQYADRLC